MGLNNLKLNLNLGWLNSGGGYSAEYQAVLDYFTAQGYELPDADERFITDTFIRSLVSVGAWGQADQILIYYGYAIDREATLVNLKKPGVINHSLASDSNFNRPYGWGRFQTTTRIKTNFVASTNGGNYTQDDAGIIFYVPLEYAASNADEYFGASGASVANGIDCQVRRVGDVLRFRLNHATAIDVPNTSTEGLYHLKRTARNSARAYKDGVAMAAASSTASTGLTSQELSIGCFNSNGTQTANTSKYISFWMIGGSFDGMESQISAAFYTWKTGIDALVESSSLPSFPDYTTEDLSAYLSAASGLKTAVPNSKLVWEYAIGSGAKRLQGSLLGSDYAVWTVPNTATTIARIVPSLNPYSISSSNVGTLTATALKYGGGAKSGDYIYYCAFNATAFAKINVNTNTITYFDTTGVVADEGSGNLTELQKWWGLYIGVDGALWGIPFNATECVRIDPSDDSITFYDTSGSVSYNSGNISGSGKWDSGCVAGGMIYGSPSSATTMIKIDTNTNAVTLNGTFPAGTTKWSISGIAPSGKMIICGYSRTDAIAVDLSDFSYVTLSGSFDSAGIGSVGCMKLMPNGNFIALPLESTGIYEINPDTLTITKIFDFPTDQEFNSITLTPEGRAYATHLTSGSVIIISVNKRSFSLSDNHVFSRYINNAN